LKSGNRALVDRLAAEYVLGTLRGGARRHFERWLRSPQVRAMVHEWEDRLAGLDPHPQRVAPPAAAWQGIERRLALRRISRAPTMRWMAIAASVLFLAIAGVFVFRGSGMVAPPPALLATQTADIAGADQTIYWRVTLLGRNEAFKVETLAVHALEAGQALELWALPEQGNPVSLGLLPASGSRQATLTETQRAALAQARQIAVSLEPQGGSPTGLPTGPVLHVAVLETV
jgi:anti-sigma-K factor RskA